METIKIRAEINERENRKTIKSIILKAGSLKRYQNWEMFSHNDKGKKKKKCT